MFPTNSPDIGSAASSIKCSLNTGETEAMQNTELTCLWERYCSGTLSEEEWRTWDKLLADPANKEQIVLFLQAQLSNVTSNKPAGKGTVSDMQLNTLIQKAVNIDKAVIQQTADNTSSHTLKDNKVRRIFKYGWAAAAMIALCLTIINLNKNDQTAPDHALANQEEKQDVLPGRTGAILTLADGKEIVLDSLSPASALVKANKSWSLQEGTLAYKTGATSETLEWNTLTTPKGRQFKLLLPDGSAVWLNAASAITYPVTFGTKERSVQVTGEAFFEVKPDKSKPFKVTVNNAAEIEVLGTTFNVNSYASEAIMQASLVTGSISIQPLKTICGKLSKTIIQPGQQAELAPVESHNNKNNIAGETLSVTVRDQVNMEQVLAWKNGYFQFDNMKLQDVMNQLARWYDIEVVYEGNVPDIAFFGKMTRNISLNGLLRSLKASELNCRLEAGGSRLVVMESGF